MPAKLLFPALVGVSGHPFVFVVLASATDDAGTIRTGIHIFLEAFLYRSPCVSARPKRAFRATHYLPVSTTRTASYPRRLKILQTTPTSPPNITVKTHPCRPDKFRSLPPPEDGAAYFRSFA
ncbi:hypothetical protein DFH11DRAFT_1543472 [Phellopilus nigrolimitatus]|nr:hypothetical protein DFH11DRAFT_1543472 [Phellopilus nigrolimitatus]